MNPASPLGALLAQPMRPGVLRWIGLRPARRAPIRAVDEAVLTTEAGLDGDRYDGRSGRRQVTLIAAEALDAVAAHMGLAQVTPEMLRRNLVTAGVNLHALKGARLRIGGAVLEITGECHPCSRMEETLGPGGYNAVRGHGGLTARVLSGGSIRIGDVVSRAEP